MKAVLRNKFIMIGGSIVLIIVILVLLAPVLTPYEYGSVDLANKQLAPCAAHPLGTDFYGRDVLCRILYGGRISLTVAVCSALIALVIINFINIRTIISIYFKRTILMNIISCYFHSSSLL